MDLACDSRDVLRIERFRSEYIVSHEHPNPELLRRRLDEGLAGGLGDSLSAMLSRSFVAGGEGVWVIRSLRVDVDLDAGSPSSNLSRRWASRLTTRLADVLRGNGDSEEALYFASRAAYLAHFLTDLADGSAWTKWYYNEFAGLRMLSASAAIRTSIVDRQSLGLSALLHLRPADRNKILDVLTEQDAGSILASLASQPLTRASDNQSVLENAVAVLVTDRTTSLAGAGGAIGGLDLFLRVCDRDRELAGDDLARIATALATLESCRHGTDPARSTMLMQALLDGDTAALYGVVGPHAGERLAPLATAPKSVRQRLVQEDRQDLGAIPRHTPFGGLFLLLPLLDSIPLRKATETWPDPGGGTAIDLVRFLILVRCCGKNRALPCFTDPLLRDLLHIPPSLQATDASTWLARIGRPQRAEFVDRIASWRHGTDEAVGDDGDMEFLTLPKVLCSTPSIDHELSNASQGLLRGFSHRLPGFGASSLSYLYRNFLDLTARLEEEPARRVVRLGCPPLNVILSMTGMARGSYHLSWLDDRPFYLYQEG